MTSLNKYTQYFEDRFQELIKDEPTMQRVEANEVIALEFKDKHLAKKGGKLQKLEPIILYLNAIKAAQEKVKPEIDSQICEIRYIPNIGTQSPPKSELKSEFKNKPQTQKKQIHTKIQLQINYCNSEQKLINQSKQLIVDLRKRYPKLTISQCQLHGLSKSIEVILVQEQNILIWHTLEHGEVDSEQIIKKIDLFSK